MASVISRIQSNGINYALAHSAYAECATAGDDPDKVAIICTGGDTTNNDFKVVDGVSVMVKFTHTDNTIHSAPITLNVNGVKAEIAHSGIIISGPEFLYGIKWIALKSDCVYQFVYHEQGNPDSALDPYWEIVGDGLQLSQPLICYYDMDSGKMSHSVLQIYTYILYKSMLLVGNDYDGDLFTVLDFSQVSLRVVSNDSAVLLDCIGIELDGLDNIVLLFRQHLFDETIALTLDIYNNIDVQYITFQPTLDAENKLDHTFIDLTYQITTSTSGGNTLITFA